MIAKPLKEHHLEFLSLKGGCTGSSESTLVKTPHCWESHVAALLLITETIVDRQANKKPTELSCFKKNKGVGGEGGSIGKLKQLLDYLRPYHQINSILLINKEYDLLFLPSFY